MKTSEKIKAFRLAKGLSQEALGELVGVKKAAINKYETGRVVNIKRTTLVKLADALGVSPADLLDDEELSPDGSQYYLDPEVAEKAQEIYEDPNARILLDAKRDLNKEDLDYLIRTINLLKEREGK